MTELPSPPAPAPLHAAVAAEYQYARHIYFDLETIPDQSPNALAKARQRVKPPANMKKRETIAAWWRYHADDAARALVTATSFDGGAGHVCTVGWAENDGDVFVEHATDVGEEAEIIGRFFRALPGHDVTLVGHNILGFDIPFLLKRAVVLGVPLPSGFIMPRDPKPWSRGTFDTMTAWAGSRDRISLNRLCGILGIVGKSGFDGSDVADAWASGDHETIARYCDDDVRRVRSIHQKFIAARF